VSPAAAAAVACLILIPGLGATLALLRPPEAPLPTRLALTFALGVAVVGGCGFVLAVARVLEPLTFFPTLGAVTAVLWALGLRRASPHRRLKGLRDELRSRPWPLLLGLLVVAVLAAMRLAVSPDLHFGNPTAWRYWADSVEVADAGRIPSRVLQYGAVYPSTVNKVLLNVLGAGVSFAIGREALPGMASLLWLGSAGLAVALWALGWELGLRLSAPLVPVLLIANRVFLNREFTADLIAYKAEIFGRLVAVAAAAIGVRALRGRGIRDGLVAGALMGAAMAIHLVPVIIGGGLLAAWAVARVLLDRSRNVVRTSALMVVAFVAVAAPLLLLPHGDLGLAGAGGPGAYESVDVGFDPTLYLNGGAMRPTEPHRFYLPPRRVVRLYAQSATGVEVPGGRRATSLLALGVAGFVGAAVGIALAFPRRLRAVGPAALGLAGVIVLLTWWFSLRYELYIPARFGVRRLFDYSSIPLVLVVLGLLEGVLVLLGRIGPWPPVVAGTLAVAVATGLLLPGGHGPPPGPAAIPLRQGLDWIREHTPCGARFLANQHTEGVFEAATGRVGILEGATPYLRPSVLRPTLRLFLSAREFFRHPEAGAGILGRERVDYVVVFRVGGVGYREAIGPTDVVGIEELPALRRVFTDSALAVYRVVGAGPSTVAPSAFPGYRCLRGPLPG
jgi:hypothetical protein